MTNQKIIPKHTSSGAGDRLVRYTKCCSCSLDWGGRRGSGGRGDSWWLFGVVQVCQVVVVRSFRLVKDYLDLRTWPQNWLCAVWPLTKNFHTKWKQIAIIDQWQSPHRDNHQPVSGSRECDAFETNVPHGGLGERCQSSWEGADDENDDDSGWWWRWKRWWRWMVMTVNGDDSEWWWRWNRWWK